MIELHRHGRLAEIRINHAKALNPFTRAMTAGLTEVCRQVESDGDLDGALIWGGPERAFSVGGDFSDLRKIASYGEALAYLSSIVDSYQALLAISKPLVAAIDQHAIGQGLQVALMSDWRIASERASVRMPELANGMPCPLGACILELLLGRAAMLQLVVGCHALDANGAQRERLIDQICAPSALFEAALQRLSQLVQYPQGAWRSTKRIHNGRFIAALEAVRQPAAQAHAESFLAGQSEAHFKRVLGNG
jgi:enoyl-CoA hydratase/carnithine racemase